MYKHCTKYPAVIAHPFGSSVRERHPLNRIATIFTYQHNTQLISENSTTTVLSIFDNAYDGFNGAADFYRGKMIAINNSTVASNLV